MNTPSWNAKWGEKTFIELSNTFHLQPIAQGISPGFPLRGNVSRNLGKGII